MTILWQATCNRRMSMIEVVLVPVGVKLLHDTGGLAVKSVPI
jgi:hypothetical protein